MLFFLQGNFKHALESWREEYGDVVGFQLGSELAVALSDYEILSNAFKDSRFTGRPKSLQTVMSAFFSSSPNESNAGIVFTDGHQWTEQRRFAFKTLRDFGFGKKCMEDVILYEVQKLEKVLSEKAKNSSTSLSQSLSVSVVNSIWSILTGETIPHGDSTVKEIVQGTEEFIKNESLSGSLMMLPWLRHIPFVKDKFMASRHAPLKMRKLQNKSVEDHQQKFDSNNNEQPSDFIEAYLRKIQDTTDSNSSFYGEDGMLNLQRSLTDLFGAGSETSSSLLLFAFLYMTKYPEVQAKVQVELEEVMGSQSTVTLEHRPKLPYTDAVLHEVMRHACLVYTVPHATTTNVDLNDYHIPSQTAVYANVWNVMHNQDYWKNPDQFDPSRFLDENGNFHKDDHCIPFMLGKRFCIGQSLAQIQLFLFFAGMLHKFNFKAPTSSEEVSIEPIVGFLHSCPSYDVVIEQR